MKKIFIQIFSILLLGMIASCSGFLDTYPSNAIQEKDSYETLADMERHWNGMMSGLKGAGGFSEAGRAYGDIQCDLAASVQGFSGRLSEVYNWNIDGMTSSVTGMYATMWNIIGRANKFLTHLPEVYPKVSKEDSIQLVDMAGSAYFVRALCYSELVKYFCEAYDPATADKQLGMPIVETAGSRDGLSRASLKDTYDFIFKDLDRAQKLISFHMHGGYAQYLGYSNVSQEAVRALRARMALYCQDYHLATEEAYYLIVYAGNNGMGMNDADANQDGVTATDMFRMTFVDDLSLEVFFAVAMMPTDVEGSMGRIFCEKMYVSSPNYLPVYIPSRKLVDMYDKSNDIRYDVFFTRAKTDYSHHLTWEILVKDGHNPRLDMSANSPAYQTMPKLFRLAEQFLILAEANAQPGMNLAMGQDALNTLKKARIKGYNDMKFTEESLLEEVKKERVRELCFEGFRLADLKRWKEGFRRQIQPFTNSPGNEMVIEANNPLFTWPIPKHELDVNPNMQKNASN